MDAPSGYPAGGGGAQPVAGAIRAAVGQAAAPPEAPERASAEAAGESPLCADDEGAAPGIMLNDKMVERLMESLEEMEDDYSRTMAAEADARLAEPVAAPLDCSTSDRSDGDSSEGEENCNNAYMTIGSDGGSSGLGDGDEEVLGGDIRLASQVEADRGGWPGATCDDSDFQDFQGNHLENFADFGSANPLLPPPPVGMSQWEATPLTDSEVNLIKETMKQVAPTPPAWALNLGDRELQRMMRAALAAA